MESTPTQVQREFPALVGLQGIAALAVLAFHLHHLAGLPLPSALAFVGTHGGLGVQGLFVLGGFLIWAATAEDVGRSAGLRGYWIRGFFRIAPLFYLMLVVWIASRWMRGVLPDWSTFTLNVLLVFGLVPGQHESLVPGGWAVGVAMIFFAVVPLLVVTIRNLPTAAAFLGLAAVASGSGRAALVAQGDVLARYAGLSFIASLVVFAVGITAYLGWRRLSGVRGSTAVIVLATAGLAVALSSPLRNRLLESWRPDLMLWSLCFGGLIIWQATAPARVLASWPLRFLGARTYGIYLLHPLAIVLLKEPIRELHAASLPLLGDWAFLVAGGFVTAVVVGAAAVTYAIVEKPGIRAGKWLVAQLADEARCGDDEPSRPALHGMTPPQGSGAERVAASATIRALLSGPGWSKATAALAVAMLGFSGWATFQAVRQPLVDIHAFRQTQTALTADWMVREGWRLDYQTPVAGAPWSIPFEFPVYQTIVAGIVAVTGFDLPATGRVVSWLFLVGCCWPAFAVARRMQVPRSVAWAFCALLWSAPLYVYWGRTFMIETAAFFLAAACLPWWIDVFQGRGGWRSRAFFLVIASLAVLQKSTTGGPVLLVLLIAGLGRWLRPGREDSAARAGAAWATALTLAGLAIGGLWAAHADAVKLANPLGRMLTGGGLSGWNFGTLPQKLDFGTWQKVVWERVFSGNAGGLFGVALLAGFWTWPVDRSAPECRRERLLVSVGLTLFLLPILIFTNLHVVHDYYQVACVAFLLAALAVVIGGWLPRVTGLSAAAPLALLPFLIWNLQSYHSYYGIVVARPLERQDPVALERYHLGNWLREATPEGSGLVVFGQAWSSELPFHAGRKGCVCPAWYPNLAGAWEQPDQVLGGLPLGAIVVSPQSDGLPTQADIDARVAAGGWRHQMVQGSHVLVPAPGVTAAAPPTDPGDSTTAPR